MGNEVGKIIYTKVDEAPSLATYSFLPIIKAFTDAAGVTVETKDISLAGRIIANFPENLTEIQKQPNDLAELGELVKKPEANVIKLPCISASIPQLKAAIKELQGHGYNIPDYPEKAKSEEDKKIKDRFDKIKGSAVNPVLREGNSDRRVPGPVKSYAKENPHPMGEWTSYSKSHVAHMSSGDLRSNEKSTTITNDTAGDARIEFVEKDGNKIVLKEKLSLIDGEIIDSTIMNKHSLRAFLDEQVKDAKEKNKWIIGPATVGGISAGGFRIGNTAGMLDNIVASKLHRQGSVAYVSKSGGLSNELNNIIAMNTDGVYEGVAIGGDRYPGSTFIDHMMRYEANPDIKMMVLLGEVGGVDEYEVVEAMKKGRIKKPIIAWCIGTCSKVFPAEVQFGHAGARAGAERETADVKNKALKEAGAYVPTSFDDFDEQIKKAYTKLVKSGKHKPIPEVEPPTIPLDYAVALKQGVIRRPANFIATISDDRGEELRYCGVKISKIFEEKWGLGGVIGLLWFKKNLPPWAREFIERVVLLTADHGPAVSGAHNSIIASRAGKDLISSLVSGLLTIGPRFGGAVQGSADHFTKYLYGSEKPSFMVKDMKSKNVNIQGIGHRIKSVTNPDVRVTIMVDFAKKNFPITETYCS